MIFVKFCKSKKNCKSSKIFIIVLSKRKYKMIEQQLNVEIEDGHEVSWAENFRMVDIKINA